MACFFGKSANLILLLTKIIHFLSSRIDFYYTSTKPTCFHLQITQIFNKIFLVNMHFSFGQCVIWSIMMPPYLMEDLLDCSFSKLHILLILQSTFPISMTIALLAQQSNMLEILLKNQKL